MKKFLLLILLLSGVFFLATEKAEAYTPEGPDNCSWSITDQYGNKGPFTKPDFIHGSTRLTFTVSNLIPSFKYSLDYKCFFGCGSTLYRFPDSAGKFVDSFAFSKENTDKDIIVNVNQSGSVVNPRCKLLITPNDWVVKATPTPEINGTCKLILSPSLINSPNVDITLKGEVYNVKGTTSWGLSCLGSYAQCSADIIGPISKSFNAGSFTVDNTPGPKTAKSFSLHMGRNWPDGQYSVTVRSAIFSTSPNKIQPITCSADFSIPGGVTSGNPLLPLTNAPPPLTPFPSLAPLCKQIPGEFYVKCKQCIDTGKIWTAIGCIAPDFGSFISQQVLGWGVGVAGAVAFLYFLWGALLFLTSAGNPEKVAMAREIIMSSLMGLLLIIFSVYLLKIISVDILRIPGFSSSVSTGGGGGGGGKK